MGNGTSALKVFVDEKKRKVMFAEAEEYFVEILFSFLTLPLGTIARLSRKPADLRKDTRVGSLSSLHESIQNLNISYFSAPEYKDNLIHTINSSADLCEKLKVNMNDMPLSSQRGLVFLKKKGKFIITDDLTVLPLVLDTSIMLFNSLGVDYINSLQQRTMYFGLKDFFELLKRSLLLKNPLTNLVFGRQLRPSTLTNLAFVSGNSGHTQTVKLLVQKSKEKVLCAQAGNQFVELLFSFLTIPLGAYERLTKPLTKDGSTPLGISNLYNSISRLGDVGYLKSEDVKKILLFPKLSPVYNRVTDFLPIYEENRRTGSFLKEKATFIVSDDLKVTTSPSIDTISAFNTPGVPIGDMELLEFSICEQEALLLLKASLTSIAALTDWLKLLRLRKKLKDDVENIALAGDDGKESEEADATLEEENLISL